MTNRNLLVIVGSEAADLHTLAFAETLAKQNDAFLTALVVGWRPELPLMLEGWVVDARWESLVSEEQARLRERHGAVAARLARNVERGEARVEFLSVDVERRAVAAHARHADLAIIGRPDGSQRDTARRPLIEAALFESGRPVIMVPPGWKSGAIGRRILVGWNASRESARAVADGMPFLLAAEQVVVAIIDAKPSPYGHGERPGTDIATHLARNGVKVELRNLHTMGRSEALTLLFEAQALGSDLVVMGGYGRSRLSETVFGGMTREMMTTAIVPVMLSH